LVRVRVGGAGRELMVPHAGCVSISPLLVALLFLCHYYLNFAPLCGISVPFFYNAPVLRWYSLFLLALLDTAFVTADATDLIPRISRLHDMRNADWLFFVLWLIPQRTTCVIFMVRPCIYHHAYRFVTGCDV
jgi:hypothetical protein